MCNLELSQGQIGHLTHELPKKGPGFTLRNVQNNSPKLVRRWSVEPMCQSAGVSRPLDAPVLHTIEHCLSQEDSETRMIRIIMNKMPSQRAFSSGITR